MVNITREFLEEKYVQEKLSLADIEKEFGFKISTVHRKLIDYGIPRRGFGGHKNQLEAAKRRRGKPAWNKGKGRKYYYRRGYKYILAPSNPMARKDGFVAEHRVVMSEHLGRTLSKKELVHHKNGIKDDNRIKNLSLLISTTHCGEVSCPHCRKKFFIK